MLGSRVRAPASSQPLSQESGFFVFYLAAAGLLPNPGAYAVVRRVCEHPPPSAIFAVSTSRCRREACAATCVMAYPRLLSHLFRVAGINDVLFQLYSGDGCAVRAPASSQPLSQESGFFVFYLAAAGLLPNPGAYAVVRRVCEHPPPSAIFAVSTSRCRREACAATCVMAYPRLLSHLFRVAGINDVLFQLYSGDGCAVRAPASSQPLSQESGFFVFYLAAAGLLPNPGAYAVVRRVCEHPPPSAIFAVSTSRCRREACVASCGLI